MPRLLGFTPALALTFGLALGLAGPSLAQTSLSLPPPGSAPASDSAAANAQTRAAQTKPTAKKAPQPRKRTARPKNEDGLALPGATTRTRGGGDPTFSNVEPAAKPRRFVPEEFDDDANPGSPRPIMSPSGRPGVGMRF